MSTNPPLPSWRSVRAMSIGASEAGALFDVEIPEQDYLSRFALWHLKAGTLEAPPPNKYMRAGNRLERAVFDTFREECGLDCRIWSECDPSILPLPPGVGFERTIDERGAERVVLVDPVRRLSATLDGLEFDAEGLLVAEAKNTNGRVWRQWREAFEATTGAPPEDGDPNVLPMSWLIQVTQQMALSGVHRGRVMVLVDAAEPFPFRLDFRPEVWAAITDRAAAFWTSIAEGREPDPNYERGGDQDAIARLFVAHSRPDAVDLSDDAALLALVARRQALAGVVSASSDELDAVTAEIKHLIGPAERVRCGPYNLSSKPQAALVATQITAGDVGRYVAGYVEPNEDGAYIVRRASRPLRVTEPKPKKGKSE